MQRAYAGIGSRKTPCGILELFAQTGKRLAREGYVLRSGHAPGADQAFERGCDAVGGRKEIYIPWINFEQSDSVLIVKNREAFNLASAFHPRWGYLSVGAKKLHARNSHQILGWKLNDPAVFVVCWTEQGAGGGGTGQALRIADHYRIPVFDAGKYVSVEEAGQKLLEFLNQFNQ